MLRVYAGVLIASVGLLPPTAVAEMYKYSDENGVVHYVDSPGKIPVKYRTLQNQEPFKASVRQYNKAMEVEPADSQEVAKVSAQQSRSDRNRALNPEAVQDNIRHQNGAEFWSRRKRLLEAKVINLERDCSYWRSAPLEVPQSRNQETARSRGLQQCDELVKVKEELDGLSAEVRRQGGKAQWVSE